MNGETYTLNGSQTCSGNDVTFEYSCADLYTGAGGLMYKVEDSYPYGDPVGGYYVGATVYHPTCGSVAVTRVAPITSNCASGVPNSGDITFSGDGGSWGTITFTGCDGYTITHDDGAGNAGTVDGTC